jgi:hypothetical protein
MLRMHRAQDSKFTHIDLYHTHNRSENPQLELHGIDYTAFTKITGIVLYVNTAHQKLGLISFILNSADARILFPIMPPNFFFRFAFQQI